MSATSCTKCDGSGREPGYTAECWYCFGTGEADSQRRANAAAVARLDEPDAGDMFRAQRRSAKAPYYSGAMYPAFKGTPKTSADSPLVPAHLETPLTGRLTIGFAPGKVQGTRWDRDMDADLDALRHEEITHVLCLVEDFELQMLQMTDYAEKCADRGIMLHRLPIKDGSVGKLDAVFTAALTAMWLLEKGENVYVHCKGGLGRAGVLAACILLLADDTEDAHSAISAVRAVRSPRAIENKTQENFIHEFARTYGCER